MARSWMGGSGLRTAGLRTAGLTATLGLAGLAGCGAWAPTLAKETRLLDAEYSDAMALDVQTRNGGISVTRSDGETVRITARLKARSQDRLEATRIVTDHDPDGTLLVRVQWPDGERQRREGCSFEIETPGADGVRLDSSNGALRIDGLAGDAVLDTSNGSVTVRDHDGSVHARTSNGSVTLDRVSGDVFADTSNGGIHAIGVSGAVKADTSNGNVVIELSEDAEGPIRVGTSNGGVRLVLTPAFRGVLVLDTSNGGISYDTSASVRRVSASRNHARMEIGQGGPSSVVSTSNGSIRVEFVGGEEE